MGKKEVWDIYEDSVKEFYEHHKDVFFTKKMFVKDEWDKLVAEYFKLIGSDRPSNKMLFYRIDRFAFKEGYNFVRNVLSWDADDKCYRRYHIFSRSNERPFSDVFVAKR
jgi:hypothetical protein